MALYHLRAKVIQRSNGQSAVKSAAYRHGQGLKDERLGRTFSYKKPDVAYSAIIAPEGAPAWVFDRQTLWNRVEKAETRINSQVGREVEISLMRELSPQQRIDLVRAFVTEQFVARGMVADIAIHTPIGSDGFEQPHAHVMLTMRRLDPTTATGFAKTKARDWNEDPVVEAALREAKDAFRKAETPELAERIKELDEQRNIHGWRAAWAERSNRALEAADAPARVDHRTLVAQGITREAQPNLGLARHLTPHIERAYSFMKERVSNWLSVLKRNELRRAFAPYEARDPSKFSEDVAAISSFTNGLMQQWRRRPRTAPVTAPEVPNER